MRRVIGGAACALVVAVGLAATVGAAVAPKVQFLDTKLKNGLRVIIAEDHTTPVFSVAVTYNVGSRNERPGRTGFAHLFEHMMFKGSENVGSGEHFALIFGNGGNMNGSTNKDRTNYFEQLPVNQLDLALFLESDRMRTLASAITPENLQNQISTVQEERRQGVDNQPYGKTYEAVDDLAYESFPYKHSVIGSMADLGAATVDDVKSFFTTYYAPNNAVLAIVGDVKTQDCLARVQKFFESIPSQAPPAPVVIDEPLQKAEKRQSIEDGLARLSRLDLVYHIPQSLTPDHDALTVLASVLSGGRSSRLYENVVRQQQLATNANASADESRGPGLFRIVAMVAPGKTAPDLEKAILAELEKVKTGAIESWEIDKARNAMRASYIRGLGTTIGRAVMLSQFAVYYGDPGLINTRPERISKLTAADIQRVATKYLTAENRTVVVTVPKAAGAQKGGV
jgi:zinc protease